MAGVIEKEEANFLATIDAGLSRIERIFEPDEERASRHRLRRPRPPTCSKPTASRRNCSKPWPPNAIWPSTGRAFARRWSGTGSSRAAGRRSNSSGTDPLDAAQEGLSTAASSSATTRSKSPTPSVVGIIANDQLCDQIDEVDHEQPIVVRARQDAVLRRDGRPGGRHRRARRRRASASRSIDTQVDGGFILHRGHLREGRIELGTTVAARVDADRRQGIRRAHSATHLLHYALQKHLGKHALQQGSKVDDDCCVSTSPIRRPSAPRSWPRSRTR